MDNYAIGVDLGGTNLRAASYSTAQGFRVRRKTQTRLWMGPEVVAADLCNLVQQIIDEEVSDVPIGICVAAPGPLELPIGRFHEPPNLPGWDGFVLREILERRFDCPIHFVNDANAAALAECHLGSGKELGVDNLVLFTLGTGVGTGIIAEGQIVEGANGLAGEVGHVSVFPDGETCVCGNLGCLEMYASATGIRRMALSLSGEGKAPGIASLLGVHPEASAAEFYALALTGDAGANLVFERAGRALGMAIAAVINTSNPALVAVAGGVSEAWPLLSPIIFQELRQRSFIYRLTQPGTPFQNHTLVRLAMLGADAGLLGAAMLPLFNGSSARPQTLEPCS